MTGRIVPLAFLIGSIPTAPFTSSAPLLSLDRFNVLGVSFGVTSGELRPLDMLPVVLVRLVTAEATVFSAGLIPALLEEVEENEADRIGVVGVARDDLRLLLTFVGTGGGPIVVVREDGREVTLLLEVVLPTGVFVLGVVVPDDPPTDNRPDCFVGD